MAEDRCKLLAQITVSTINDLTPSGNPDSPTTVAADTAFSIKGGYSPTILNPTIKCSILHPDGELYRPDSLALSPGNKWTANFDSGLPATGGLNALVVAHLLDADQQPLAIAGPYFHKVT